MWRFISAFMIFSTAINTQFSTTLEAQTKNNIRPLAARPLLSGSFGELRATHFHSGIDLKTGGGTGLPVRTVNDGVVARIRISATGYGNALYVEHPDGTTSVYGHLQQFNSRITDIVRKIQYNKESFEIDEDTKKYQLIFTKGDTIARSGNTGSSGGPHLHFEYRNTQSENALNPLKSIPVKDNIPPQIKTLYLYRISPEGQQRMLIKKIPQAVNPHTYTCGQIHVPAGSYGIAVYATDAMNDSGSKLGVYRLTMRVNGKETFCLTLDSCSFDQSPLINEQKDFSLYRNNNETVYCCFGNYIDRLLGVSCVNKGFFTVPQQGETVVDVTAADINGNSSKLSFRLLGDAAKTEKKEQILAFGQPHVLKNGEFSLQLDTASLFYSINKIEKIDTQYLTTGKSYRIFVTSLQDEPLLRKAKLQVRGKFDSTAILCRMIGKTGREPLPTYRDQDGLYSLVHILGRYTVASDVLPPTVAYIGIAGNRLKFKISDNLSGIAAYRGEVNGKWCLFEYDAKTGILSGDRREQVFQKGKSNRLVMRVTDRVGNKTEKTVWIKN